MFLCIAVDGMQIPRKKDEGLLVILVDDFSVILRLYLLPALTKLQVVDHIEFVIGFILWVDSLVKLLSHVFLECGMVTKSPLTV